MCVKLVICKVGQVVLLIGTINQFFKRLILFFNIGIRKKYQPILPILSRYRESINRYSRYFGSIAKVLDNNSDQAETSVTDSYIEYQCQKKSKPKTDTGQIPQKPPHF